MSKKNKKVEEVKVEDRKIPAFNFMLDGDVTFEQAGDLLDIICCFANSHGWVVGGGFVMQTQEEFDKENHVPESVEDNKNEQ